MQRSPKNKVKYSISSTVFNKAFLPFAWKHRGQMAEYEKRGFYQFVYLTLSGHMESVLSKFIELRIQSIVTYFSNPQISVIKYQNTYGHVFSYSIKVLQDSYFALVRKKVRMNGWNDKKEFFEKLFDKKIKKVVGTESDKVLESLFYLRNLFAHGCEIVMEFNIPLPTDSTNKEPLCVPTNNFGDWDAELQHQLKKTIELLRKNKLIRISKIKCRDYNEIIDRLYSDDVLLFFYRNVQKIESMLRDCIDFEPEKGMFHVGILPVLDD